MHSKIDNKALELTQLPRIFNLPEAVFQLPDKLTNNDNYLTIMHQLVKAIRNKILNYKEAAGSISGDEDVSFCFNNDQCVSANSSFWDPYHKHIITGDLRITKNNKFTKLLTKRPNYREPRKINFSKALIEIATAFDTCIEAMILKNKYANSNVKSWKEKGLIKRKKNKRS